MTDTRPFNCRNRLRDEGKAYPRSGCASCKNGGLMGCPHEQKPTQPSNFANHPQSLNEVKADREQDGRFWTPRDALIDLLRDIDAGKIDVQDVVIVHRGKEIDDDIATRYNCAGPSGWTIQLGMLTIALNSMANK